VYLARFSADAGDLVQGLVRVHFLAPPSRSDWSEWTDRLAVLVGGLARFDEARVAARILLRDSRAPECLYSVLAPASR